MAKNLALGPRSDHIVSLPLQDIYYTILSYVLPGVQLHDTVPNHVVEVWGTLRAVDLDAG